MIRNLANFSNWIGGVFLAIAGTVLARWPFASAEASLWTSTGGRFLAIAGLAWIAIGISRQAAIRSHPHS